MNKSFSWLSSKLEARNTEKKGKGIFAKRDIARGEKLAIFGGYVLTLKEEENLPSKYRDTGMQISEDFVLTTKESKEDTDCFNHSCDPNSGFKGQIFLVAMRNIKKEEEITLDYAMVLCNSKNAEPYKMNCLCNSKNCRKIITDNDWKIPSLQKKYKGYFQYYLEEKINKK